MAGDGSGPGAHHHLWAFGLANILDDSGEPLVFVTAGEPHPATSRLMRSLGVEVRVVSTIERGYAAQDHRASVARAARRRDAGETVQACSWCKCEEDVPEVAHALDCKRRGVQTRLKPPPSVVEPSVGEEDELADEPLTGYAKGRATREANEQKVQDMYDRQPSSTRCAIGECPWRFEGTAVECRDAFAAHRAEVHPTFGQPKGKLRAGVAPTRPSVAQPAPSMPSGLDALERMDAGQPQRPEENPMENVAEAMAKTAKWTTEAAIVAIKDEVAKLGYIPTGTKWNQLRLKPSIPTIYKLFGSYNAVVAGITVPSETAAGSGSAKVGGRVVGDQAVTGSASVTTTRLLSKTPRPSNHPVGKDECVAALQEHAVEGVSLTSSEWKRRKLSPAYKTITRRFGSWGEACEAAGLQILRSPVRRPPSDGANQEAPNEKAHIPTPEIRVPVEGPPIEKQDWRPAVVEVLRTLADAIENGLFTPSSIALICGGIALEMRKDSADAV